MKKELITIQAVVDEIIYSNDQNGFTVCQAESEELSFCAVGYLPYISEGETLEMTGSWTVHPDYGEQFKVEYYEKTEPSGKASIEKYLSSGVVSGVGKVTAKRIVDLFGENSLRIIRDEPEKLCAIKGISLQKAENISKSLIDNENQNQKGKPNPHFPRCHGGSEPNEDRDQKGPAKNADNPFFVALFGSDFTCFDI